MKKTLVAIAAIAAVGAASAQSSVTLYGRLDASVGKTEIKGTGNMALTASDVGASVNSGQQFGSRWGMRGSEDLGGGMKANFVLESGIGVDDGRSAQGGRLFGRAAYLGLNGGFGSLTIGRQLTLIASGGWAITGGYANYDAWGRAGAGSYGNLNSVLADAVRKDHSVVYATPSMGGLVASVMWAPGENGTAATSASNYLSFGAQYDNGPIRITAQHESDRVGAGGAKQKAWIVGGRYDLGVVALSASLQRADQGTMEDSGYALGLSAPLGPVTIAAEFARETTENAGTFTSRANALNVRVNYSLSKRTLVYGFLSDGKARSAAGGTSDLSRYSVGLVHSF